MKLLREAAVPAGGGRGRDDRSVSYDDASPDHYKQSHVGCNCDTKTIDPSDPWRKGFTRRSLIKGAGYLAAAPLGHQMATTRMAFAAPGAAQLNDVVCLINIRGGWDMNVAPPYGDPVYAEARPNLRVPENLLIKADGTFGLNQGLRPLARFWDDRRFLVVQGCALEQPNYSHFTAQFQLDMGDQRQSLGSGWANRVLQARGLTGQEPLQAVQFGGATLPMVLRGQNPAISIASTWEKFKIFGDADRDGDGEGDRAAAVTRINSLEGNPLTNATRNTMRALGSAAEVAAEPYTPSVPYPEESNLGDALREIARTIKSGAGLQLAVCDSGGWDTHTKMGSGNDPQGNFNQHVAALGAALGAFCEDLDAARDQSGKSQLDRTLIILVAEFGRRIGENRDGGSDHGYGQPMLLIGGGVKGGRYVSNNFNLAEDENGNVRRTYDYRQIIAECLLKRGGVGDIRSVFPGLQYGGGLDLVTGI